MSLRRRANTRHRQRGNPQKKLEAHHYALFGAVITAMLGAIATIVAALIASRGSHNDSGPNYQATHPTTATASPDQSEPTQSPTIPATMTSTTQAGIAYYLNRLTGVTQPSDEAPAPGTWKMDGTTYDKSLGYQGFCGEKSITYILEGEYKDFITTLGVADSGVVDSVRAPESFGLALV